MDTGSFTNNGELASSRAAAPARSTATDANTARRTAARTICAFWIGERCFGLDTSLVAEIVSVEAEISVPLAPAAVRGIFNLRGEPLPLISFASLLDVPQGASTSKATTAMVFRAEGLAAGLVIDRVQAILSLESALLTPANANEDRAIQGFIEATTEQFTTLVAVIEPSILLEKLTQLRFLRDIPT